MVPARREGLWRLAPALLPLGALLGCPQLLSDDFYVLRGERPDPDRPRGDAMQDASVESQGGASGGPSTLPGRDAGNVGDAGLIAPPPLSDVQVALRAAMVHRYRFDSSATLLDSVGGADVVSVGATFSGGAAVLAGTGTGQYLDLPNGILSGLRNVSLEVWLIWDVTDPTAVTSEWQRIFDFGRNPSVVEGQQCQIDVTANSLFLSPTTSGLSGPLLFRCESCADTTAAAPSNLAVGVQTQLVGVVDDDANRISLYQNGVFVSSAPFLGALSTITSCTGRAAPCDWNNWIGRSQHVEDPPFKGRILDFRIYSAPLAAGLVQASFAAGPDAAW
jgi:hypothetical protein